MVSSHRREPGDEGLDNGSVKYRWVECFGFAKRSVSVPKDLRQERRQRRNTQGVEVRCESKVPIVVRLDLSKFVHVGDRRCERVERDNRVVLSGLQDQDRCVISNATSKMVGESRLAKPRFSDDQRRAGAGGGLFQDSVPERVESVAFFATPNEGKNRTRTCRGGGQTDHRVGGHRS